MNEVTNILGDRLREFRSKRGLSQKDCAALFRCCQQMIGGMESGKRRPSPHLARRMATASGGFLSLYEMRPDVFGTGETDAA